ncbi:hypothetical protein E5L44_05325 [Helicobacter pylori]|nr:hypothetical protein E5L44_05325 [Helicobacter pylori]
MWHSKDRDGYAYNIKNNSKGEFEATLIEFFFSETDRIKRRKEKKHRFNKVHCETTPC